MKRYLFGLSLVLATVALGLIPIVAIAQEAAFKAHLSPTGVTPVSETERLIYHEGNGTHLGLCTAEGIEHNPPDNIWEKWGSMTLTAANNDLLFLDVEIAFDFDELVWVGSYTICGGTGRFLHASGTGDLVIAFPGGPPTWIFDGIITF